MKTCLAPPRPSPGGRWQWTLLILCTLLFTLGSPGQGEALTFPDTLVQPMWLFEHLDQVVVLDVRDDPDSFGSRRRTNTHKIFNPCGVSSSVADTPVFGHIPGAVLVPWQEVMVDRQLEGEKLLQMIPDAAAFQTLMQQAGVNNDSPVVIAGRGMNSGQMAMATRLFWTLKYYGHDNIALLDGGTAAWIAKKRRVRFYSSQPPVGNFTVKQERKELLATTAEMVQWVEDGSQQIVDVRGQDYFEGLSRVEKYVLPNGEGHIPTAVHLPASPLLTSKAPATFLKAGEIQSIANKFQVSTKTPTVLYCNVGLQGSLAWFAWHEILKNGKTRLYDGSMHAWSRDPNREVAGF